MAERVNWIQALVVGEIEADGSIHLTIKQMTPMTSPRPKSVEESGADPDMIRRINERVPGRIETLGFIGGAVAQIVPLDAMDLLPQAHMAKLYQKYGLFGPDAFLAMVRNTGANAIWNCAEPSGGMAEDANLMLDQLKEGCELGIFNDDGWCHLILPPELASFQAEFTAEQRFWWEIVKPGFPVGSDAGIELLPVGRDTRNGQPGICRCGPVGDVSFTIVTRITLSYSWFRFLDTESRPGRLSEGERAWVPLRRKVVAIVPRPKKSPLMLELNPEGQLHPGGLHVVIDGENTRHVISHLSTAVLEALGWFPKEGAR